MVGSTSSMACHMAHCKGQGCGQGDCGFRDNHNISLFTSGDLSSGSWHFEGDVLPVDQRPSGIYYRPKVVYNAKTQQYVLWVNWLANRRDFGSSKYLVATSPTPKGPFKVVNSSVVTKFATGGDFDIFVDKNGEGYLSYTSLAVGHGISIEKLNADYLSSTLESTGVLSDGACYEAPSMFERNSKYYLLYGRCCCFCTGGGENFAVVGSSPMDFSASSHKFSLGNAAKAQQNFVAQVKTADHGVAHVWMGDRWNSAPDSIKDHDFQYWQPLVFNDDAQFRFIKASGDAVYFEDVEKKTKHHAPSCNMCWDPCSNLVTVPDDYISGLSSGSDFECASLHYRFIKRSAEDVFYEDISKGTKHHVDSCDMCGNPCSHLTAVDDSYIEALNAGANFSCDMLPIRNPISPITWVDEFQLTMPGSSQALV